jgi:HAD superfamily hydrolase (TIGR01549 family)
MKIIDHLIETGTSGVIFDLDGTLINTLSHHVEAFINAFNDHGYNIDRETIKYNMGRTPWDIPSDILFNKSKNDLSEDEMDIVQKVASAKINYYHESLKQEISIQDGTREILEYLKDKNTKLAVCSSTPRINVNEILKKIKIFHYFGAIITGDDIKIGKPNPEPFLLAINKLKLAKEDCFIIGDSVHDIEAANRGKIKSIGVCTGFHLKTDLEEKNPHLIINTLVDLLKIDFKA